MKSKIINISIWVFLILVAGLSVKGQDAEKSPLIVTLSYFTVNNDYQYLKVNAKSKVEGKFQPAAGVEIQLYLNKDSTGKGVGLIGKVITNEKGNAAANIPPALKQTWDLSPNHTFVAVTDKSKKFDETNTDISIAKAKITVDTTDDKNVTATFTEFKDNKWVPVKGVDIKLGIKRLGGDLLINDDQSYTTDSLGKVKGEFKKIGMPGDEHGNIMLVAKVEDNDQYGNLRVERSEPWGVKFVADNDFFHRALWASRFNSPVCLVVIAYSILIAVWGTLIYLVFLLIKIRTLGKQEEKNQA